MIKSLIFAAPSGSGKTSIVRHLLNKYPQLKFSISATTRPKRENEIHGKDYFFLQTSDFISKIKNGEFLEWQEVYSNSYYGTLNSEVSKIWNNKKIAVFDMDVFGAMNLKDKFKSEAVSIFIKAPTFTDLENRLKERGTETEESIKKRIQKAKEETKFQDKFDVTIVNNKLENALKEAENIVCSILNK